jgi:O-antigen ligase
MRALSPRAHLDAALLRRLADWLVVLIAVVLPWSISATAICIVAWLLAVLPSLDLGSVRREIQSPAGGLPVLLWCLGVTGMLWADVSWTERLQGLGSFHRLLVIPLLLAQFRRSEFASHVVYGFLISSALALIATYAFTLTPGLTWRGWKGDGIAAHDAIFQGSVTVICAFAILGCAATEAIKKRWLVVLPLIAIAAVFLAYFLIVVEFSRVAIAAAGVLVALLGWRLYSWKGLIVACLVAATVSGAFWFASATLRERVSNSIHEIREYSATNKATPIGQHITFLKESLTIISSAPLIGYGTGSIAKEFRQITSGGSGAAGVATVNPHNQTFAVAIQLGVTGVAVLWAMWIAHFRLFRGSGIIAWVGTVIVLENVVSSAVHSHLFDSVHGWLYVFGVGVLGGTALRQRTTWLEASTHTAEPTALPERHRSKDWSSENSY